MVAHHPLRRYHRFLFVQEKELGLLLLSFYFAKSILKMSKGRGLNYRLKHTFICIIYSFAFALSPCLLACNANAFNLAIAGSSFVEDTVATGRGCGCDCGCG